MRVSLTVSVPYPVYDVYSKAAQALDRPVAQVMSEALEAYVHNLVTDMLEKGEISVPQA